MKPIPASHKPSAKGLWERTGEKRLLRNTHSGQYYFRYKLNGKQKWLWLKTDVETTAKLRMLDKLKDVIKLRASGPQLENSNATMGELMDTYLSQSHQNAELRPATVVSRVTGIKKIVKTWPGIRELKPQQITTKLVWEWANRFKLHGTGFRPPKSKSVRKGNSASSVNRSVDILRHVLDLALDNHQIFTNPVVVKTRQGRLKKKVQKKKLVLPSRIEAERLLAAMRKAGQQGGWGIEAALLCSFLQRCGARIGEVPLTTWKCIDWEKNQIFLPGYKTDAAPRIIPLFEELKALILELIEWRKATAIYRQDRRTYLEPDDSLFRIKECQKTIDAACSLTGVTRITHHDWRHFFATSVIEAGVDMLTLSQWLGHSDGGVLAQKTYGHLRTEHSQRASKKVRFGVLPVSKEI
jgi:integrase